MHGSGTALAKAHPLSQRGGMVVRLNTADGGKGRIFTAKTTYSSPIWVRSDVEKIPIIPGCEREQTQDAIEKERKEGSQRRETWRKESGPWVEWYLNEHPHPKKKKVV
jgi:hypothetical protein